MKPAQTGTNFTASVYLFIFTLSGFSGLIYESIWSHYLKLFLGHAADAQTLVLLIFMGGMAVGALIAGKFTGRLRNLLRAYAVIEGILGLFALLFHDMFQWATGLAFDSWIPHLSSPISVEIVKYAVAIAIILPQSILLGATFPLMSAGFLRKFGDKPGQNISRLYALNSLGAAIGVLISGFWLISMVGLPGAMLTAGVINIVIFCVVFLAAKKEQFAGTCSDLDEYQLPIATKLPTVSIYLLIACAFGTGMASFMYEIAWLRMLSMVLGSSTHAFELMLSAFILGLAIGGWWIKKRVDTYESPWKVLGFIQLIMGVLAVFALVAYNQTFDFMRFMIAALDLNDEGYLLFNLGSHLIALLVMLPATICAGMTLPLITHSLLKMGRGEGALGQIYAANTFGSIIGIVVSVHILMEYVGVKNIVVGGALIDITLGFILLAYFAYRGNRKPLVLSATTAIAVIAFGVVYQLESHRMASGLFRVGLESSTSELMFHQDGRTATVSVMEYKNGVRAIATNGKVDAGINVLGESLSGDEPTMVLLAAIPLAAHNDPKDVAVIGFGSGMTTHTLLESSNVATVDTVEIEPAMVEGAKLFGQYVANAYEDPRSNVYIDDAKTYFAKTGKEYDIIISEPSNPWVSGVSSLFTSEFYQRVSTYLKDDGVFAQWFHLYEMEESLFASVMKGVGQNFSDYAIYMANDVDLIIVAKKADALTPLASDILSEDGVGKELKRVGLISSGDLGLRYMGGKSTLGPLFGTYPIPVNSDYFPTLDNGAVKARFKKQDVKSLQDLGLMAYPVREVFWGQTVSILDPDISLVNEYKSSAAFVNAKGIFKFARDYPKGEVGLNYKFSAIDKSLLDPTLSVVSGDMLCMSDYHSLWLRNLKVTMAYILPFSSANELNALWPLIESGECFDSLGDEDKAWYDLYKAIGTRNHRGSAKITSNILPEGEVVDTEVNRYLLFVNMASNIKLGEFSAAKDTFERFQWKGLPSIPARMLIGIVDEAGIDNLRAH